MSLYLKNALYINPETIEFRNSHIRVDEGEGGISFVDELPVSGAVTAGNRILDCSGKIVTGSFGCGHHHIYSALARGMPAPEKAPANFHEILKYIWWRLDKALDKDSVRASALVTALYCLKNGVTFIIDHHSSPNYIEGSLDCIASALDEAGMSHLLCYEISDRDGPAAAEAGLGETARFLKAGKALVGLHASFTVGEKLLRSAVDLAHRYKTGVHIHTAEDEIDQVLCARDYGVRVVERYRDSGMLALRNNILTHCLYLSPEEWRLIEESGSWVTQAAESNLNNGVGIYDGPALPNLMLGTDGMHSDMLRSAKISFFLAQAKGACTPAEAYRRFRNVHRYIKEAGVPGDGANNLVILNYNSPTVLTKDNFFSHFIYGLESRHVESVISSGKLVVEKGKVLTIDETEVLSFAKEEARTLWKRISEK